MRELKTSLVVGLGLVALGPAVAVNVLQVVVARTLDATTLGPDEVAALHLLAQRLAELDFFALVACSLSAAFAAALAVLLVIGREPVRRAVVAATLAGLSAWLAHRVFQLSAERALLRMLGDTAFDPAVRARLVAALGVDDGVGPILIAAAVALTGMVALARGRGRIRELTLASLLVLPIVVTVPAAAAARRGAVARAGHRAAHALTVFGIEAPPVTRPTSIAGAPDVIVLASGRALPRRRARLDGAPHVVYADPSAAFREVFGAVGNEVSRIVLAGQVELPDPALGELGPLVGPRLPGHDVTLARGPVAPVVGRETLSVVMIEGHGGRAALLRLGRGRREASFATEAEARDALAPLLSSSPASPRALQVRYTPAAGETAGEVVQDLDLLARVLPSDPARRVEISL